MKEQLRLIPLVITSPKLAFQSLPSDRFYILAWCAPLYFGIARVFSTTDYEQRIELFGGPLGVIAFALIVGVFVLPVSAWILQIILILFRKFLSVRKLMNIYGYSLTPRLIVSILGYIILIISPSTLTQDTPLLRVIALLGIVVMFYSLILFFYGIIVCPSEET